MADILFRCHYLGDLMTEPRSKADQLSETTKKRLVKVFIEHKYKRECQIESKYIEKGLKVEEDSITVYSRIKKRVYHKNTETISNNWITGTPDFGDHEPKNGETIMNAETIIDTKSSWDLFTFWNSQVSALDKDYYWQAQGYMDLTGARSVVIAYCLNDTPQQLIVDEQSKLRWKMGVINPENDKLYQEAAAKIERNMTYGDIPLKEKMFEHLIVRDKQAIERMHERVEQCREWMRVYLFNQPIKAEASTTL